MPQSVLITGGAGFIGSHLAEALLATGTRVAVIDDLSTGAITNIRHLRNNPRFAYVLDSISNEAALGELIDESDTVVHLAAAVGVDLIVRSPVRTIETNVSGTEVVLKWAAKKGKRVFVASTSEVYGKSVAVPFREDADLVLGPPHMGRWSYACSKLLDAFLTCPPRWCASSIPLGRAKRAATAWWCHALCAPLCAARRYTCMAAANKRAALPMLATPCGRYWA
jgi:UDP-glucose 4-epimerase